MRAGKRGPRAALSLRLIAQRLPGLLLLCMALTVRGEEPASKVQAAEPGQPKRPRIGLVLGGGGARGVSHIGVLKVLQEMRVPVDIVVGTSMGALVGGAFASGKTAQQLQERLEKVDWELTLSNKPSRPDRSVWEKSLERDGFVGFEAGYSNGDFKLPSGVLFGQKVEQLIGELVGGNYDRNSFDNLPIPYRAVATDLLTGDRVILDQGNLVTAMRASMSVPGVFSPVEYRGLLLVDGGLSANLPVEVARSAGADVIIAVDLEAPLLDRKALQSVFGVTYQMVNFLTSRNSAISRASLKEGDVLITPELGDFSSADFVNSLTTVKIGEAAARKVADKLAAYSLSQQEFGAYRTAVVKRMRAPPTADVVRLDASGLKRVPRETLDKRIGLATAKKPTKAELEEKMSNLINSDDFQQIRYHYEQDGDQTVLVIEPIEKEWGPNYLRFGLDASFTTNAGSYFDLLISHRATWLNSTGLEWRNELSFGERFGIHSELLQPLDYRHRLFVAPSVELSSLTQNLFVNSNAIAQYKIKSFVGGLDLGYRTSSSTEVRLGYRGGTQQADTTVAVPGFPEALYTVSQLRLSALVDQLDNWSFPTQGAYASLVGLYSSAGLGAHSTVTVQGQSVKVPSDYTQLALDSQVAAKLGTDSVVFGLRGGTSFNQSVPLPELFPVGGFLNLSGYAPYQYLAEEYVLGRIVYYHRIGGLGLFAGGTYVGGSLEGAYLRNVVNTVPQPQGVLPAISAFYAMDTPIGPVYFAAGAGRDNNYAFYVYLGRR